MGDIAVDPFGLRSLDLAELTARSGAKWHRVQPRLAAWVADMDFPVAPVIRDALAAAVNGDLGYPDWPYLGRSPLPEITVERMHARFGWEPDIDRLHELSDVMQAVQLAVHHLTEPGDGVVLHTPAYHPFLQTLETTGRRLVAVPSPFDHDELDARLAHEPARLMILCNPHNPTGHVFTRPELTQIADIAARHDIVVVADEVHADLVHAPNVHVAFETVGPDVSARSITVTSPSKAFNVAGLRWAILHAGHAPMHDVMRSMPRHYFGAPNILSTTAAAAAWTQSDDWLAAVKEVLDENRQALVGLLATHLPGVRYCVPEATYLAWLDCRELGLGDDPAAAFRSAGVELSPGPQFGPGGVGHARLNFATSPSVLEKIVATMGLVSGGS
ncbi:MAG TPA: aminotransferase class I/II-fold pyridoxal phosphate-dependent enzyme [Ilumatobacteraceae bacterium]